jgi:O-antigen/teichoic acid export membrane protein
VTSKGSAGRVIAANSGWQLVTFAARTASGLGAAVLVARAEGPRGLGVLQLALTVTALLGFAGTWGLPNLLAREVSRLPAQARLWLESGALLALSTGALLTGGFGLVLLLDGGATMTGLVLAVGALAFDSIGRLEFAYFWSRERMVLEAAATWLQEGSYLIATVVLLGTGHGVLSVLVAFLVSRMLGAALGWVFACRLIGEVLLPRPHRAFLGPVLRRTMPFAGDDAMSVVYIKADSVLLQALKGPIAVGLYQACTTMVLSLNILARMLNNALYARLSRAFPDRMDTFGRLRDSSLRVLGAVGVPIAVGTVLLARRLLHFVYGTEFAVAATCLVVLALVVPIRMVGHTLGTSLTAANAQTPRTWCVTGAAALNIAVDLVLIPLWSYVGAAWGTVVTETALVIAYAVLLHRRAGRSVLARALGFPALASVPLVVAVALAWTAPLPLTIAAGAVGYGVGLGVLALIAARRTAGAAGAAGTAGGAWHAVTDYVKVAA